MRFSNLRIKKPLRKGMVEMTGQFEKQIQQMKPNSEVTEKIVKMINAAGDEFSCPACPSKSDCDNYKWFIKWFEKADKAP